MAAAELTSAQEFFTFFTKTFNNVDTALLVQRGIVGGTALPAIGWGYTNLFRPGGSVPWLNARAAECLTVAEQNRAIASQLEGRAASLQAFLAQVIKGPGSSVPVSAITASPSVTTTSSAPPPAPDAVPQPVPKATGMPSFLSKPPPVPPSN